MATVLNTLGNVLLLFYRILEHLVLLFVPNHFRYKNITGQLALVTGGGSGIGRQTALGLAEKGARVVVWDLDGKSGEETCQMIRQAGGQAHSYVVDVTNAKAVYSAADRVRAEVGKVNILVNNAGIVIGKPLLELPDEGIEKVFGVNTLSHFWTCKAFLPDMMVKNEGHVVTIASLAGLVGLDRLIDYCATKHSAVGFSESLTLELRNGGYNGVKVTCVCPFVVSTGLFEGFNGGILPPLTPENVAQQIISALLINQKLVVLPKYMNALLFLRAILPYDAQLCLADILDADKMMLDFKGGRQNKKNN